MFESCRGRQGFPGTYAATPVYWPVVTSHREYPDLAAGLLARGLGAAEVGAVLGGNLVRIFAEVLA